MTILKVDFEKPEDFVIVELWPRESVWQMDDWMVAPTQPDNLFEPETGIVHSGLQSAKLALTNPHNDATRRIHVERAWDPNADFDVFFEEYVFLPVGTPVDEFIAIHRVLEERIWDYDSSSNWWQIGVSMNALTKVADDVYRLQAKINHGFVDNNRDGINELDPTEYYTTPDAVNFGEWTKIASYVHRDVVDGRFMLWINDVLQLDLKGIRTIGIDPDRIGNIMESEPRPFSGTIKGWVMSGLSLYTAPTNAPPKYEYVDDVYFSNEFVPNGTVPISLASVVAPLVVGSFLTIAGQKK